MESGWLPGIENKTRQRLSDLEKDQLGEQTRHAVPRLVLLLPHPCNRGRRKERSGIYLPRTLEIPRSPSQGGVGLQGRRTTTSDRNLVDCAHSLTYRRSQVNGGGSGSKKERANDEARRHCE